MTPAMGPRFALEKSAPVKAPKTELVAGPFNEKVTAENYCADLVARKLAKNTARLEARWAESHVTPLCRTFDLMRG